MVRYLNLLIFALALSMNQGALAALEINVDRNQIELGETFTLTLSSDSVELKNSPDFSLLQNDFEVLGQNQSSSVNFVNWKSTSLTKWVVRLAPKREGSLTIPAFKMGDETSEPISIEVKKNEPANSSTDVRPVIVELVADGNKGYVQQQQVVTIRFYHRVPLTSISGFEISPPNTIVHPLDKPRNYQKAINGQTVGVYEQSFALFPQQSGPLTVGPITIQADGPVGDARFGMFSESRRYQATSYPLELTILPQDPAYSGGVWLPAESLKIEDQWSVPADRWKVGEAVTLTLVMQATGLSGSQLPNIEISLPTEFRLYPEEPTRETQALGGTVTGQLVQRIAVIPTKAGSFTLPPLAQTWFNTRTKKMETTTLAARQVTILPSTDSAITTTVAPPVAADAELLTQSSDEPLTGNSIHHSAESGRETMWFWSFVATLTLWIATLCGYVIQHRRLQKYRRTSTDLSAEMLEKQTRQGEKLRELHAACKHNQARMSRDLLLQWSRLTGSTAESLREWAHKTEDSDLLDAVNQLEHYLYAQSSMKSESTAPWKGMELWKCVEAFRKAQTDSPKIKPNPLPPLSAF